MLNLRHIVLSGLACLLAGTAAAEALRIENNKTISLRLDGPASTIVIGNHNIADVAVQSERLIFITGKMFGTTNLMIHDRAGRLVLNTDISVTAPSDMVTLTRAGMVSSFSCSPECRPTVSAGDENEFFNNVLQQQLSLQSLNSGD